MGTTREVLQYFERRKNRLDARGIRGDEVKSSLDNLKKPWSREDGDWEENKHPRGNGGQFVSKGQGGGASGKEKKTVKAKSKKIVNVAGMPPHIKGEAGSAAALDHDLKGKVSPEAEKIYHKAVESEKKISPVVQGITDGLGGRMSGIEFSCKTASSLVDKVKRKHKDDEENGRKRSDEDIVAGIGDMVRYTSMFNHDDLGSKTKEVISQLEKAGHKVIQFENFYNHPKAGYKGLHLDVVSPEGQQYELQIHSDDSMKVKNELHPLYEKFRAVDTPAREKMRIKEVMERISSSLSNPKGIDELEDFRK